MADEVKTVTVAESPGQTVVVNNQNDGAKKYSVAAILFLLASILKMFSSKYPGLAPVAQDILDFLAVAGYVGSGTILTSPFDRRGVVLRGDKVSIHRKAPNPDVGRLTALVCILGMGAMLAAGHATLVARHERQAKGANTPAQRQSPSDGLQTAFLKEVPIFLTE